MSTAYYLVNPERERATAAYGARLAELKREFVSKIEAIEVPDFLIDDKDDLIAEFNSLSFMAAPESFEWDKAIGTSTAATFHWRTDNGFRDMACVLDFMKSNTQYEIRDEYNKPVSVEEFKTACAKDKG